MYVASTRCALLPHQQFPVFAEVCADGQNRGMTLRADDFWASLKPNDAGLVPVVVQQVDTREVLMMAWMSQEALSLTLTSGAATYWSRSRDELWIKGSTSGNTQRVISLARDCDGDTLLMVVDQIGAACHTGDRTCFDAVIIHPEGSLA